MHTESLDHPADAPPCEAHVAYDATARDRRPWVIVAHAWDGQNDVIRRKAEELAGWGYVGFAAADAPAHGLRDHEAASRRAWTAARQFFKEVLQG